VFSFVFGVILTGLGVVGPFIYEPCLGLAVYAAFTFITPQQLGIASLRAPLLVAIATLISYFLNKNYPKKLNLFPAELKLYVIMLLGMLLGAYNAYDSNLAFEYFEPYWKYGIFLLLMINILDSRPKVEIFNNFMILGAAWLVYKCWDLRGAHGGRFENTDGGVVGDSNQFAAALIMLLPLVMMRVFRKSHRLVRIAAALGVFGMVMSVIISTSRGGFLGLITLFVCFFIFYKNYRKRILLFSILVILSISPFMTDYYFSRISTITISKDEKRDESSQSRLDFWSTAIDVWQKYPIYGCGLRNFTYYNGYANEGLKWGEQGHVAHSLWFEALGEGGTMVFVPLVWMIVLFFRRMSRAKRQFISEPEVYADITAFQIGMIGFLVCATFVNRLIYEPIYWWCCLSYVYDQRIGNNLNEGNIINA
jgi:probable O-glycosylation ligase (exosortase A-associated)